MSIAVVILVLILTALAVVLGIAAGKSSTFTVRRRTVIKAAPEAIFARIEDLRAWADWSPFEKLDANMTKTFEGPARGVGAAYGWQGDRRAGAGRIEILSVEAPRRIELQLDMFKPMAATNQVQFRLIPGDEGVTVSWIMTGKAPFLSRLIDLLFNMDKLVGKEFESGLASLKAICEA